MFGTPDAIEMLSSILITILTPPVAVMCLGFEHQAYNFLRTKTKGRCRSPLACLLARSLTHPPQVNHPFPALPTPTPEAPKLGPYAVKPRIRLFFQMTRVLKISQMLWYCGWRTPSEKLSISGRQNRSVLSQEHQQSSTGHSRQAPHRGIFTGEGFPLGNARIRPPETTTLLTRSSV